jgi:glycosyltransferase involved in cell wall biosynthesis
MPLKRWLAAMLLARVSVIAPSQYVADKLVTERSIDQRQIRLIYNGVADRGSELHRSSVDRPVELLACGRLHPDKGHAYLVDALALLKSRQMAVRCRIAGDGPLRTALQTQIDRLQLSGEVKLLGQRDDVADLLQTADILVLPSLPDSENFPLIILEAMSAGLPVVASRVGGVPEQVVDGQTGVLVEPGQPQQLAAALAGLISDSGKAHQLSAAARQRYLRLFTFERMLKQLTEFYED